MDLLIRMHMKNDQENLAHSVRRSQYLAGRGISDPDTCDHCHAFRDEVAQKRENENMEIVPRES